MTIVSIFNDIKWGLSLHSASLEGSEGFMIQPKESSDFFIPDGGDVFIKIWPTMIMVQGMNRLCFKCGEVKGPCCPS